MNGQRRASKNGESAQRRSPTSEVDNRVGDLEMKPLLDLSLRDAGDLAVQAGALRRIPPAQGRALAARIGRVQGNRHVQQVLAVMRQDDDEEDAAAEIPTPVEATEPVEEPATSDVETTPGETVEAQAGSEEPATRGGGRGPGRVQHAEEQPYTVTGATLDDITGQLNAIDGFAAETNAPLGLAGEVQPERQEDDTYRVEVTWAINDAVVRLPQWADYDEACPAAQAEWDRFMTQVRRHEQEAHIDMSRTFVSELGEEDTVVTGETVAELQRNLAAKQEALAGQLQERHDECDHGASIDAILHPDDGRCPVEEEGEETTGESVEEQAPEIEGGASSGEDEVEAQAPGD
jgi:predicted secreted Zn-dependent protease